MTSNAGGPSQSALTPKKASPVGWNHVLTAPGAQVLSGRYSGTVNPDGLLRLKSTSADADGKVILALRRVGLPQGWPGQEQLQINTAGKNMWSSPWQLADGAAPPWDHVHAATALHPRGRARSARV